MNANDDALGALLAGAATLLLACLLFGLALHWADPDPQPIAIEGKLEDGTETVRLWQGALERSPSTADFSIDSRRLA